jgi:glucose/arabinose dehydrogenase
LDPCILHHFLPTPWKKSLMNIFDAHEDGKRWMRGGNLLLSVFLLSALTGLFATTSRAATALQDPIPQKIQKGEIRVKLEPVATGLTAPNWGTSAPGDANHLYVSDQNGILWKIDLSSGTKSVFLDLSAHLVTLGVSGPNTSDERGFLGFAFHPDYAANGLLYTYTSEPLDGPADFSTMPAGSSANHQSVITEWRDPAPGDPDSTVDSESARVLMRVDEPQYNHNAGAMNFGPDGMLYVAFGDGGGASDSGAGHGANGNGQDPANLLGAIIRIDPTGSNSANGRYGIPSDNPVVGRQGVAPEVFAYGFRNPFRFSFDSRTGQLYAADAGQNDIEELDLVAAGGNYGWNLKEGSFFFNPNGNGPGFVTNVDPGVPGGLIDPIAEYDHDEGVAVIGGFVYRGKKIPALYGHYIFGDFSKPDGRGGRLFYLDDNNRILELQLLGRRNLGMLLLGFAQDASGEIYALANRTGTPFGETGTVFKLEVNPTFDFNTLRLHVPAVDVLDIPTGEEGVFQVDMVLVQASDPITFQLTAANRLPDLFRGDNPMFRFTTGILDLPFVDVILPSGVVQTFSMQMSIAPFAENNAFFLMDFESVPPLSPK